MSSAAKGYNKYAMQMLMPVDSRSVMEADTRLYMQNKSN